MRREKLLGLNLHTSALTFAIVRAYVWQHTVRDEYPDSVLITIRKLSVTGWILLTLNGRHLVYVKEGGGHVVDTNDNIISMSPETGVTHAREIKNAFLFKK